MTSHQTEHPRPQRRRIIVTKRRLIKPTSAIIPTYIQDSTIKLKPTKRRRLVIVTKKRLLPTTSLFEQPTTTYVEEHNKNAESSKKIHTSETVSISEIGKSREEMKISKLMKKTQIEDSHTSSTAEFDVVNEEKTTSKLKLPEFTIMPNAAPDSLLPSDYFHKTSTPPLYTTYESLSLETITSLKTRHRTYTYVVTRVHGTEQLIASTTSVRDDILPVTLTVTHTQTLTKPITFSDGPTLSNIHSKENEDNQYGTVLGIEEARYNLATRIMSNGVEVIVAGDKNTLHGEHDVLRLLPSSKYKAVTLAPSTITNQMMMILPPDSEPQAEILSSSLHPNQFVTKTCLTTYTYLTTYLQDGTTSVSSHEKVISNIATEERNTAKILPTPTAGITLTQNANLGVGVFHTTYTYVNTMLDGDVALVVSSKHTVTNTVTAPDDYLSLLQPSEPATTVYDTNTYYSTVALTKTLIEGTIEKLISTTDVLTQVVITESIPPKVTSVMTSYIALDVEDLEPSAMETFSTTDVVKTYFVTYTYFKTYLEDGSTVVRSNVSTSSDVVTEKLYINPKKTQVNLASESLIIADPIINGTNSDEDKLHIYATKTYLTTFTYFTTLLQDTKQNKTSTVINSHTRVVENVVTESIKSNLLNPDYLRTLKSSLDLNSNEITNIATLADGQELEITAVIKNIKPTKVEDIKSTKPIESTKLQTVQEKLTTPSVITGSTIIFFDEDDQIDDFSESKMSTSIKMTSADTEAASNTNQNNEETKLHITPTSVTTIEQTKVLKNFTSTETNSDVTELIVQNVEKNNTRKPDKNDPSVSNLLGLGIDSLTALRPVFNAMAGLIQNNLQASRRNDTISNTGTSQKPKIPFLPEQKSAATIRPVAEVQNRSPIYIPVGGLAEEGIDTAESQNIAQINYNAFIRPPEKWGSNNLKNEHKTQIVIGKPTHETPLLNGGIPISPGEVITANSDVIIGKPAIIGPRIPFNSHNQNVHEEEVPIGMIPPPLPPSKLRWPNRDLSDQYLREKVPHHNGGSNPIPIHAPNRDDYFGPPPLAPKQDYHRLPLRSEHEHSQQQGSKQHNKNNHQHRPLRPVINSLTPLSYQEVHRHHSQPISNLDFKLNEYDNRHDSPHINYIPNLREGTHISSASNNKNLHSQIVVEPILLPEIVERSTGQPLLVNIQPSQVANVIIPHGSTTALIFGGSTEPHKNGQYFDDPSPYPEPETGPGFVGIENYSNGVPQFASVYNENNGIQSFPPKQNIIISGTHLDVPLSPSRINVEDSKIQSNRPVISNQEVNIDPHVLHQGINVNVPPISFGTVQDDNQHSHQYIGNNANRNHYNNPDLSSVGGNKEINNVIIIPGQLSAEAHISFGNPTAESSSYETKVQSVDIGPNNLGDINVNVSPQPLGGLKNNHVLHNGIVLNALLNIHQDEVKLQVSSPTKNRVNNNSPYSHQYHHIPLNYHSLDSYENEETVDPTIFIHNLHHQPLNQDETLNLKPPINFDGLENVQNHKNVPIDFNLGNQHQLQNDWTIQHQTTLNTHKQYDSANNQKGPNESNIFKAPNLVFSQSSQIKPNEYDQASQNTGPISSYDTQITQGTTKIQIPVHETKESNEHISEPGKIYDENNSYRLEVTNKLPIVHHTEILRPPPITHEADKTIKTEIIHGNVHDQNVYIDSNSGLNNLNGARPFLTRYQNPLLEYMTPPLPVNKINSRPDRFPRPQSIPIHHEIHADIQSAFNNRPVISTHSVSYEGNNYVNVKPQDYEPILEDTNVDQHKDDDIENEEGEVIQESNSRPLLPGQIPAEIVAAASATSSSSTTTQRSTTQRSTTPQRTTTLNTQTEDIGSLGFTNRPTLLQYKTSNSPRPFGRPNISGNRDRRPSAPSGSNAYIQSQFSYPIIVYNNATVKPTDNKYESPVDHHIMAQPKPFITNNNMDYFNARPVSTQIGIKPTIINTELHMQDSKYSYRLPGTHQTSLPINNIYTVTKKPAYFIKNNVGSQTEEPFDTKYTKSADTTTNPPVTQKQDVKISQTTKQATVKINYKHDITRTTTTPRTTTVTSKKISTTTPQIIQIPSTAQETDSADVFKLNIGEIPSYKPMQQDDYEKDTSEIFDFKESTHPHNLGSIKTTGTNKNDTSVKIQFDEIDNLKPPPLPVDTIYDNHRLSGVTVNSPGAIPAKPGSYDNIKKPMDLQPAANTPRPYIPKPSEDMKPPPIIDYHSSQVHPEEEVMGLSPPPPAVNVNKTPDFLQRPGPILPESTHRPIYDGENIEKRPYLETFLPPKPMPPYTYEMPTSSERPVQILDKRPTARPTYPLRQHVTKAPTILRITEKSNTSSKPTLATSTTKKPAFNRIKPVKPILQYGFSEPIKNLTTTKQTITPSKSRENATEAITQEGLKISTQNIVGSGISTYPKVSPSSIKSSIQPAIPTVRDKVIPTELNKPVINEMYSNMNKQYAWNTNTMVLGSETSIDITNIRTSNQQTPFIRATQAIVTEPTSTIVSIANSGSATIYGNLFTRGESDIENKYSLDVHHAGNEIKIQTEGKVQNEAAIQTTSSIKVQIKPTKVAVPTRYVTHTQTLTVTTTETTIIKSQGSPPSTLTLVVTKTQTSTIVDTVTQIHTLIQPTNVVETVTTTVHTTHESSGSSYYPNYPAFPVQATAILQPGDIQGSSITDEQLDEFIINDDLSEQDSFNKTTLVDKISDNDSIFVVMTDQKPGVINIKKELLDKVKDVNIVKEPDDYEMANRDEEDISNEVNRVLLGGVLIASPPRLESPDLGQPGRNNECRPDCKASRNELCQRVEGIMRCVCRPGFARMFPDRPCKPTYTYSVHLGLSRHGKEKLKYEPALAEPTSPQYTRLAAATHEGLDRMVMQSDLRDVYHGVLVNGFEPTSKNDGVLNRFYVQLSDNTDEGRLKEIFIKYLRNNNYSLGGTELYAAKEMVDELTATDFDECLSPQFHDCSEHAQCFNLRGTYTCSCREGFADLSENSLYPGRICSAELIGCEKCHYHGTCYSRGDEQILCECFQWYAGESCHINLKVLLIALVTLGAILFTLLLVCIILTCMKRRGPRVNNVAAGIGFLHHRAAGGVHHKTSGTLDKRAMIQDTSSEGSQTDTNTLPYVKKPKISAASSKKQAHIVDVEQSGSYDQRDRSLTVMIPRAKYHPAPATSPLLNMEAFDRRKISTSSAEAKLLSYLDAGPSPNKENVRRKSSPGNQPNLKSTGAHKTSTGALVSAGFEVSATVVGTEADRSENATLIHKISTEFLSNNSGAQSQFTLRKARSHENVIDPMADWLDVAPSAGELTVSEARSYDETTIQAPTKTLRSVYDSKPSSHHLNNDEANTMAERDLGSTFLLPHTHLYKPDRGSDISGFDSL